MPPHVEARRWLQRAEPWVLAAVSAFAAYNALYLLANSLPELASFAAEVAELVSPTLAFALEWLLSWTVLLQFALVPLLRPFALVVRLGRVLAAGVITPFVVVGGKAWAAVKWVAGEKVWKAIMWLVGAVEWLVKGPIWDLLSRAGAAVSGNTLWLRELFGAVWRGGGMAASFVWSVVKSVGGLLRGVGGLAVQCSSRLGALVSNCRIPCRPLLVGCPDSCSCRMRLPSCKRCPCSCGSACDPAVHCLRTVLGALIEVRERIGGCCCRCGGGLRGPPEGATRCGARLAELWKSRKEVVTDSLEVAKDALEHGKGVLQAAAAAAEQQRGRSEPGPGDDPGALGFSAEPAQALQPAAGKVVAAAGLLRRRAGAATA